MELNQDESNKIIIATNEVPVQTINKSNSKKQGSQRKATTNIDPQLLPTFFRKLGQQMHSELGLREQQRIFIKESLVPLNNKHVAAYSNILKNSLIQEELTRFQKEPTTHNFHQSLKLYSHINAVYRECGVNSPILMATYQEFQGLWEREMKLMGVIDAKIQEKMILLWREVPYQSLKTFLIVFDLHELYQQIDTDGFLRYLVNDLFEGKIQQTVEYYSLYTSQRKTSEDDKLLLTKFEDEQLIPRLTKKDQLFTEHVLSLIKHHPELGVKIYSTIQVQQQQKLMAMTGDDSSLHQRVVHRAMRRHYHDVVNKCKKWYVIEDKLSFSPIFTQWYAAHLIRGEQEHSESDGEGSKTSHNEESEQEAISISKSILGRLNNHPQQQLIKNPLYVHDAFLPAELIMQQAKLTTTAWKRQDFPSLDEHRVIFISNTSEVFSQARCDLLSSKAVGIDTQFMPTESKFVEGGVSIIQLASDNRIYIFDYLQLRHSPSFIDFFVQLMENANITKVGHTFSSDLLYLGKNFPRQFQCISVIDIAKLFKQIYPQQLYTSLAYLTQKFLSKQLCKYEQRSNWARRPLKKTQLYYAALDAQVCLDIYRQMQNHQTQTTPTTALKNRSEDEKLQHQFDFHRYAELIKEPRFLVDNMLKKLSSTLRNCGLDAEFISIRDHELAEAQAKKEKRIIITRDGKLAQRKGHNCPIYLLRQRSDTEAMFEQLLSVFNIDLSKYHTLSRCVKCNCPELLVISSEQAQAEIKFLYQNNIREYWRCAKCRQIYWEGGQFAKAKHKYDSLRGNNRQ